MSRLCLRDVQGGHLMGVTLELDAGVHWIFSPETETANDLIRVCAGWLPPKRGSVTLDESSIGSVAHARRAVLPAQVHLPQQRVDQLVQAALELKGFDRTAQQILGDWNLSRLAPLLASALAPDEARTIALLLALATPNPKLLALHDVFALGLPRDRLTTHLAAAAQAGAVVLLTANAAELGAPDPGGAGFRAAYRDAVHWLPPSAWLLHQGRIVRARDLPPIEQDSQGTLFVVCSDARALSEQLSRDPRIKSLRLDQRCAPQLIEISGAPVETLARAVNDAALNGQCDIRHMTSSLSPIQGGSAS